MSNRVKISACRITLSLLAAFMAAGCASLRTADPHTDLPRARAQIEARLKEVFVAAESKDFDRLESYHFYGPKFTKFTSSSPNRLDAGAARKGERNGLGAIKNLKMRADALQIDIFGSVGIATFILDYSFEAADQTIQMKERSTLVFVNEGGAWKIAHEHLSPIKP